ncbi:MAG TPA: NFACT RNA binding domain-containing protein [Virgibacillus sp.]|nr:NFACT RNA binding domain-containing protein [Virgibacillus sp.]
MPFDGIVTKAITEELQDKIVNGRISKIYQPTETELVFTVRNQRTNYSLLLSIHPTYARFHLTKDKYENPQEPPMFCMLLRKYLSGAFIESIEQDGMERIVTFTMRTVDEIGDQSTHTLVIELMGRHSNVLLLSENKSNIIDSLKHVSAMQNRYRTILPGHEYIPPPSQDKMDPLSIDGDDFINNLDFNAGKLDRQIVNLLTGVSPFAAKEMITQAALGSPDLYKNQFLEFQKKIREQAYAPTIYRNDREDFHVIPITYLDGEQECFSSTNEMLDQFYSGKAERDRVKQRARDLYRLIKNELNKNERKLKIHERSLKKADTANTFQKRGELLTAHLHLVTQGDPSVTVVDYYDPDQQEITIDLQTDKTPSENAQALFTRYRKLSTSKRKVTSEILKTKREITYLDQLLQQIETARETDIEEIREELRDEGYLKKQRQKKRRKNKQPTPEEFVSTDGTPIFVGKNNNQNEYVTHRMAHRNDVWLHTKDIPGSHVIVRSQEPSEDTLYEAAQLAAYFSKAQQSSSVPVDYTQVKHVKKPRGAKPGYVVYDQQKTLSVTPSPSIITQLKKE